MHVTEDDFERRPPSGVYPFTTAEGDSGWIRVEPGAGGVASDARLATLRRLGARAVRLPAALAPDVNLALLEQVDG